MAACPRRRRGGHLHRAPPLPLEGNRRRGRSRPGRLGLRRPATGASYSAPRHRSCTASLPRCSSAPCHTSPPAPRAAPARRRHQPLPEESGIRAGQEKMESRAESDLWHRRITSFRKSGRSSPPRRRWVQAWHATRSCGGDGRHHLRRGASLGSLRYSPSRIAGCCAIEPHRGRAGLGRVATGAPWRRGSTRVRWRISCSPMSRPWCALCTPRRSSADNVATRSSRTQATTPRPR
jgi:hypothetical protein